MYDQSHVGRRVTYTDRDGHAHLGTIKDVIESVRQADVHLDKHLGVRRFYVPFDTLRLVEVDGV